jgi:hypothetical protein
MGATNFTGLALDVVVLSLSLYLDSYLHGQLTVNRPIDVYRLASQSGCAAVSLGIVLLMLNGRECVVSEADGLCLCGTLLLCTHAWLIGGHLALPVVLALETLAR